MVFLRKIPAILKSNIRSREADMRSCQKAFAAVVALVASVVTQAEAGQACESLAALKLANTKIIMARGAALPGRL
jgi:hypothetical protein